MDFLSDKVCYNLVTVVTRTLALRHIRPEEALLFFYGLMLLAIMSTTGVWRFTMFDHPRFLQVFLCLAMLVFARAFLRAWRTQPGSEALRAATPPALRVLRDFFPFFFGLVLYETLHDLTPLLRPDPVDAHLIAIDRALFGVDVAAWMSQFASPTLTRLMVHCYATYFVAPVLLASAIYWRDERVQFREYMVSLCLVTLLGYAGYLAVPAVGPYVYQAALFPTRLPGGEHTHFFIEQLDSLKGVARDCFPSMHTAHTTVVLAFTWRFSRRLFALYLPIAVGLFISTVYLRMHYVVDVFAGFAVAAAAVALGPRLERWWRGCVRRQGTGMNL
jgi:membrane-associated phospholipid phosphatase